MKVLSPPKNRFLRGAYLMGKRYLRHNAGIKSAELALNMLLKILTYLIFISDMMG